MDETPKALFKNASDGDKAALKSLTLLAETGDVSAMVFIAMLYDETGPVCIKEDLKLARLWYKKSAEKGDKLAQIAFANMCHYGQGGDEDLVLAFKWYLAAAEQGEREAQMHVARFYENGLIVDKDIVTAITWYEKAVENGHELAATNLGQITYDDAKNNEDYKKALELFLFAAGKGDGLAYLFLGEMTLKGQGTEINNRDGLLALFIAAALLPDGNNRKLALDRKEFYLAQHPEVREEFDIKSNEYIEAKGFQVLH